VLAHHVARAVLGSRVELRVEAERLQSARDALAVHRVDDRLQPR
jgi:hypothetical protein